MFILKRILAVTLIFSLSGCGEFVKTERRLIDPVTFRQMPAAKQQSTQKASPFLKAHMKNGCLYVFNPWTVDSLQQAVSGPAVLFNARRDTLQKGNFTVGMDSVAILETNSLKASSAVGGLVFMTVITAVVTVACVTNPKSCFGSCPTFYVPAGDSLQLRAEGFSASIAPSLEATDIDALWREANGGSEFAVQMKNEAMETHVVQHVNLLAAPKSPGSRVLADVDGRFWESPGQTPPSDAIGTEGDCLELLAAADGRERFSLADSTDLAAKETVDLTFTAAPAESCGLLIGCRQTLLSTYLLYQTLAYMGTEAGHYLAQIERGVITGGKNSAYAMLGGIEVQLAEDGGWRTVATITEQGPLATDFHLIPFGLLPEGPVRLRLKLTKGHWRIDVANLAALTRTVEPIRLAPELVLKDGVADEKVRVALSDSLEPLVTLPGDVYTLKYRLPPGSDYELFLDSRGYYLEWIRQAWLAEEDAYWLAQMFLDPAAALRRLAPEFKRIEPEIEHIFWSSRYAKPQ